MRTWIYVCVCVKEEWMLVYKGECKNDNDEDNDDDDDDDVKGNKYEWMNV